MPDLDRYHRQILLPGIGEAGQRRLMGAHALVVGCGALGTMIIDALARAGVGRLRLVDRDIVELTNLQRQVLFDEADVAEGIPKAEAARAKVARINSQVVVEAHVDDFNATNADRFAEGVDLVLDGLDNFETRYLVNDLAVARGLPYLYGGAVGTTGMSMPILPHPRHRRGPGPGSGSGPGAGAQAIAWTAEQSTPCLRCVFPEAPPPGSSPTCDTAGVLGPAVAMIAAHQVTQALKLLTGHLDLIDRSLHSIDVWSNQTHSFDVGEARRTSECPCCVNGVFEYLEGGAGSSTTTLCGRNAVQIAPADGHTLDLADMAARLAAHGTFTHNRYLLRGTFTTDRGRNGEPLELTLFANGRAIIKGTTEPQVARSLYAKYVGV